MNWPRDLKLNTWDTPEVQACAVGGLEHSFREYTHARWGKWYTSLVCVFCHGVACGYPDQDDPCLEIYHHRTPHRSRAGAVWAIGDYRRPDVVPS